jgi:hypothetical protein
VPVIPISLYCKPSLLRDLLTYYKPGRDQFIPGYRDVLSLVVREFICETQSKLWSFLSGWTDIAVVPSTRNEGRHPLSSIVEAAGLNSTEGLLHPMNRPGQHLRYDIESYTANLGVGTDRRILLVEDVYVTGARSQQAAAALTKRGAEVAAILTIGRRVNPEHSVTAARFWSTHSSVPFDFASSHAWLETGDAP